VANSQWAVLCGLRLDACHEPQPTGGDVARSILRGIESLFFGNYAHPKKILLSVLALDAYFISFQFWYSSLT
jgi:hypothetical protein